MSRVYLSLGSNMGDSFYYLLNSIVKLNGLKDTKVTKIAKFYKTKAWGLEEQDDFINTAIELDTKLLPYELLKQINKIEKDLDRIRKIHWGPRTIDIDIIFYDNLIINHEKLTIPHKYYKERNFVIIPLLDIVWNKNTIIPYIDKKTKCDYKIYTYPKKIAISACLLGEKVRYDGKDNLIKLFKLFSEIDFIKICPECDGGLSVPRVPCEKQLDRVIGTDRIDYTQYFLKGASLDLEILKKNIILLILW